MWWTPSEAGWIGGGLGGLIGILGACFGVAAGLLVNRGKGKPIVLGLMSLMLIVGLASAIAGITAVLSGQPYHVCYPLLLIGGIGTLVAGINAPVILIRYRQAEARKLEAQQLRRSQP